MLMELVIFPLRTLLAFLDTAAVYRACYVRL